MEKYADPSMAEEMGPEGKLVLRDISIKKRKTLRIEGGNWFWVVLRGKNRQEMDMFKKPQLEKECPKFQDPF